MPTILIFFKVKLCIYRTDNGCGWGVKTLENIRKGSFVVEYVGEVITNEEAEERGKKYGKNLKTIWWLQEKTRWTQKMPRLVFLLHYF
jgi:hypothetical protein